MPIYSYYYLHILTDGGVPFSLCLQYEIADSNNPPGMKRSLFIAIVHICMSIYVRCIQALRCSYGNRQSYWHTGDKEATSRDLHWLKSVSGQETKTGTP